jgi:hypothetical protein
MRHVADGLSRRWSAAAYAAFFALFALPFATLYAACSHERIDTVNGYQTLAQHDYTYQAANGSAKVVSVPSDGFAWIAIGLVAVAIVISLLGFRTLWLSLLSVAGVFALFLGVTAAGGPKAASQAEIGYWLSSAAVALAPAADVRPWRRAALVAAGTVLVSAAAVGAVIGLIALTIQGSR